MRTGAWGVKPKTDPSTFWYKFLLENGYISSKISTEESGVSMVKIIFHGVKTMPVQTFFWHLSDPRKLSIFWWKKQQGNKAAEISDLSASKPRKRIFRRRIF